MLFQLSRHEVDGMFVYYATCTTVHYTTLHCTRCARAFLQPPQYLPWLQAWAWMISATCSALPAFGFFLREVGLRLSSDVDENESLPLPIPWDLPTRKGKRERMLEMQV